MCLFKSLFVAFLFGVTGVSYAEVSIDDKKKFGSYFPPVKVHNQAEFDYIHTLLSIMGMEKSLKLSDETTSEAKKIIKIRDFCRSIGFSYAHVDFISLNSTFSKNVKNFDSKEKIDARANRLGLTPDKCVMTRDHISKNPALFIDAYSK